MILNEMLDLLDMKNNALEEFVAENDRFMHVAQKQTTSMLDLKSFYKVREHILDRIGKIDKSIENLFSMPQHEFIDVDSRKADIKKRQMHKRKLVTRIVDQDLLIMTLYTDAQIDTSE